MKVENKALKINYDLPESASLTQADVDDFYRALRGELGAGWRLCSINERAGAYARFAAGKGWLDGVKPKDVAAKHPSWTLVIAAGVDALVGDALEIPKDESS